MKNGKKQEKEVLRVFTTREYEQDGEEKTFWIRIGTAFRNDRGITVLLDALPLSGKLVLLPEEAEEAEEEDNIPVPRKRR